MTRPTRRPGGLPLPPRSLGGQPGESRRSTEHRPHLCRRPGLRRRRVLRGDAGPHAAYRPDGAGGPAVHRRPRTVVNLHALPIRPAHGGIRVATERDGRPPGRCRPHHRARAIDPARDAEARGLCDGRRRQVAPRAGIGPDRLERPDPSGSAGGRLRRRLHHGGDRRPGAVRVHPGTPRRGPRPARPDPGQLRQADRRRADRRGEPRPAQAEAEPRPRPDDRQRDQPDRVPCPVERRHDGSTRTWPTRSPARPSGSSSGTRPGRSSSSSPHTTSTSRASLTRGSRGRADAACAATSCRSWTGASGQVLDALDRLKLADRTIVDVHQRQRPGRGRRLRRRGGCATSTATVRPGRSAGASTACSREARGSRSWSDGPAGSVPA